MADLTFDEVVHLAKQLTPEEQKALIAQLEAEVRQREARPSVSTQDNFNQAFGLLLFDAGPWPSQLTLRREDEYGDTER
jgi:hypothetical protein